MIIFEINKSNADVRELKRKQMIRVVERNKLAENPEQLSTKQLVQLLDHYENDDFCYNADELTAMDNALFCWKCIQQTG